MPRKSKRAPQYQKAAARLVGSNERRRRDRLMREEREQREEGRKARGRLSKQVKRELKRMKGEILSYGEISAGERSGNGGASNISPDGVALEFPFLGLLVSGGHCQLLLCEGVGKYTVLGGTMDDALGEAYDKAARLLGLRVGGGGGPAVEALALGGDPRSFPLTVPMQGRKDCDFSFAGLKNAFRLAVTRAVEEHEGESGDAGRAGDAGEASVPAEDRGAKLPESTRADLAASFQHTAIRHLEERLNRAMDACEVSSPSSVHSTHADGDASAISGDERRPLVRTLAVVGGVAANQEIRRRLQALCDERREPWQMVVPPARLCTDNGVMVAWAGIERLRRGMSNAPLEQGVYARLPLGRAASDTS